MKKIMTPMLAALLFAASLMLWGCEDDDPVDPPVESCQINVTTPAAGIEFRPGDVDHQEVNIRWSKTGDADLVRIELLKNGLPVGVIQASTKNDGFYNWTANNMGASNGPDFSIRVTALGAEGCSDESDFFSMTNIVGCSMDFTSEFPDSLMEGEVFNLTWESSNTSGQVDIQLRKQDQNVGFIATRTADDGSFDWTVDSFHNGTYDFYYLRIQDSDVEGCYADSVRFRMVDEDICFIDVSEPYPGAVWEVGTHQDIMITGTWDVSEVNLMLYTGNVFVGSIAQNVSLEDFPFDWTVMDFGNLQGPNSYRIRAINKDDEYCVGKSGAFTINP